MDGICQRRIFWVEKINIHVEQDSQEQQSERAWSDLFRNSKNFSPYEIYDALQFISEMSTRINAQEAYFKMAPVLAENFLKIWEATLTDTGLTWFVLGASFQWVSHPCAVWVV